MLRDDVGFRRYIGDYFGCVKVFRPSQLNGVMSSALRLPNYTFTGQAQFSKRLSSIVHILSPENIGDYTVANFLGCPIRRRVIYASALEFILKQILSTTQGLTTSFVILTRLERLQLRVEDFKMRNREQIWEVSVCNNFVPVRG